MRLFLSKKTKMIQGQSGHVLGVNSDLSINVNTVPSPGANTPIDVRPNTSVDLVETGYTEIVRFTHTDPLKTFQLLEVMVTFVGFSTHFVLEHYDGTTTKVIREYWLGVQVPFSERFGVPIPIVGSPSGFVRVIAKMNGVNQTGKGYAIINGYMY
jgi:hypothetical protein